MVHKKHRTRSYILCNDGSVYWGYSSGLKLSVHFGRNRKSVLNLSKNIVFFDDFRYNMLWSKYLKLLEGTTDFRVFEKDSTPYKDANLPIRLSMIKVRSPRINKSKIAMNYKKEEKYVLDPSDLDVDVDDTQWRVLLANLIDRCRK